MHCEHDVTKCCNQNGFGKKKKEKKRKANDFYGVSM